MADERHQQSRPAGDIDLTGQRDLEDVNIRDGGAGLSGSGFASTGRLGGLGNTSDGMHSRRDGDASVNGDHSMDDAGVIDTSLAAGDADARDDEERS